MQQKFVLIFCLFFGVQFAQAAIPKSRTMHKPAPVLLGAGSIKGGKAGTAFSILNIQTKVARSKRAERIRFDMGNGAMASLAGPVAFFNIQNDPKNRKITVDFSQTLNSRLEQASLNKIFSNSPFVQKSELIFEPQSQSMSLVLTTKKPSAIRVNPVAGTSKRTAYLILDIFEPSLVKTASAKTPAKKVR